MGQVRTIHFPPTPSLPANPPFFTIMSIYQFSSSWTGVSNYAAGAPYHCPTPAYEDPASLCRESMCFQLIPEGFMSNCRLPVDWNHTSPSAYGGPALSVSRYHCTQSHDAAVVTPLIPLDAQDPIPHTSVNVLLGDDYSWPQPLSYDVTKPPNTAVVFSESQQKYKQISLNKSKQPVLVNPTQQTYTLEFEHPTLGRQFISTFEPSGTILSLLSGMYEYFREKLSTPEFAMLSQMGEVYKDAQMFMRARLGHRRSWRGPSNGVRKVDFLGERVMLQGVELGPDEHGRPSVLLIKLTTRSGCGESTLKVFFG